jgi:hypothetical protein
LRYGKLVWKTKVGVHNGHDEDGTLALRHLLPKLKFPLVVEPGIVGGVETTMAVADGVVYVPVANGAVNASQRRCARGTSPSPGRQE